jgi:serine/threonine-protein kinase
MNQPRAGELIPGTKYRVVRPLGAGGMGVVYLVEKGPLRGVLKLMSPELAKHKEFRERFADEVRVLARLEHPNIVRIFDHELEGETPCFVMEVLNGRTLRDVLAAGVKIRPRIAYEITRQLLEALHCAHTYEVTVVHRDIKPENIFLHSPKHGDPVVKLIDFGVVALSDRKHDGTFVGTWSYAAPEQIRGEQATPATDLYAVGLVLFEMLAGVGPFDQYESGLLISAAQLEEIPPPVSKFAPWVPESVVQLVASALAKDPKHRPIDAYAFAEALYELENANDGGGGETIRGGGAAIGHALRTVQGSGGDRIVYEHTPSAPRTLGDADTFASQESELRPRRRSSHAFVAAVLAIAVLLPLAVFLASRRPKPPPETPVAAAPPPATSIAPAVSASTVEPPPPAPSPSATQPRARSRPAGSRAKPAPAAPSGTQRDDFMRGI